ncbi:MAG: GNAT family N-acetyltransferase [Rubrobacteraceae bacterium]
METERLLLEPILRRHAAVMYPLLQDVRIYRYIPQEPPDSLEALEQRYRNLESRLSPRGDEAWLNWAICLKPAQRHAGRVEATVTSDNTAYLAYELSPEFWGTGYATEACRRVLSFLFADYSVTGVTAEVDTRNAASIRLLERLGFERIGFQAGADFFKGASSDEYTYQLSDSAWS